MLTNLTGKKLKAGYKMFEIYLPIANVTVNWVEVVGVGASVGFLSGLFGVGGGFLMTPLLNLILGIPMNVAVGSDLTQMTATASSGTIAHRKMGNIDMKLALLLLMGSITGAQIGVYLVNTLRDKGLSEYVIKDVYVVTLGLISILLIFESWKAMNHNRKAGGSSDSIALGVGSTIQGIKLFSVDLPVARVSVPLFIPPLLGIFVGILMGFMGVGGGFIMVPALVYLLGVPTLVAIGTGLFQLVITAASGSFAHALSGNVDLILVFIIIVGSTIGAQVGAKASSKLSGPRLRLVFGLLVLLVSLSMLFDVLISRGVLEGAT
jgi:hypothetical protein